MSASPPLTRSEAVRLGPASSGRRKTVAVLLDYMDLFGGGCEVELRGALTSVSEELDLNLLLVYGRVLAHPDPTHSAHNAVFQLIHSDHVDGLVTLSPALSTYTGQAGLERLFQHCQIAARCSAGVAVTGSPSIVIDPLTGMSKLLEHVLGRHRHRRVAFIGGTPGNVDADARFGAYRAALVKHGVPFDPALVIPGDFLRRSGELGMEELLRRGPPPDAVVAANDGMALGAMTALARHQLRVPEDVAVTGFDDLSMARQGDPPLTTVAQPLRAMIELAVRLVDAQLRGEQVDPIVHLPAQLIVRDSCGCAASRPREESLARAANDGDPRAFVAENANRIVQRLIESQYVRRGSGETDMRGLYAGLSRELRGEQPGLATTVKQLLHGIGADNERRQALQIATGVLRGELLPVCSPELEDLFHQVRHQIALTDSRVQVQQRLEIDQAYSLLMERGEQFSSALTLTGLRDGLVRALPDLDMQTALISIHPPHDSFQLVPLVCLVNGLATPDLPAFPAQALTPPGMLDASRRRTLLVFPLVLHARCLGLAVFEYSPGTNGYVVVRDRVSVALGGVELHQTIVENTTLHERKIQEQQRLANEERIRALNVLAGGVAHDLNNALGPLVALPGVMLDELEGLKRDPTRSTEGLRADLESIQSSALRAAQTIKDLLTMSRQSRATRDSLDLNVTVQSLLTDLATHSAWSSERLKVALDLHPRPLPLLASETHLQRAISNLVHNAVEAMEQRGTLGIRTREHQVDRAEAEREGVREGRYGRLQVSDTGKGIPREDLQRIFEPFFSSKRLSDRSGSGLGLAIVDGVVKDHGGFVQVSSSMGTGTCFTLHFPLENCSIRPPRLKQRIPQSSGRILVVDDEPVQLRTATRLLEHFGYAVTAMNSGASAYRHFVAEAARSGVPDLERESPYDLIIMDMQLNESEDGIQVYRRIRALYPRQRAMVSSGHAFPEGADADLAPGLSWLPKPYTTSALAEAVQSALRASCEAPPSSAGRS